MDEELVKLNYNGITSMCKQLDFFTDQVGAGEINTSPKRPMPALDPEFMIAGDVTAMQCKNLRLALEKRTREPISLVITNNKTTMMSIKRVLRNLAPQVRLHRMFLDAPDHVLDAVAYWILHPRTKKCNAIFRAFIDLNSQKIRERTPRQIAQDKKGRRHDLHGIFNELNAAYFHGKITATIVWGREIKRGTRYIRLGCYQEQDNVIRIHPHLDREFVPLYVLRAIIYHEMLHAHLGTLKKIRGRRQVHTKEFKEKESLFSDYSAAEKWIKDKSNLNKLLAGNGKCPRNIHQTR